MKTQLKLFKIISTLEAISFLVLLLIAMPLKYGMDSPEMVVITGNIHGFLFIAYVIMAVIMYKKLDWSLKTLGIVILCSLIPLGPFYMEKKYLP